VNRIAQSFAGILFRSGRRNAGDPRPTRFRGTRKWLRRIVVLAVVLCITWLALPRCDLLPPDLTWSRRVLDRDGNLLALTLTCDQKYRLWTPLVEMPPDLIAATLVHEDHRFRNHSGVDAVSLGRAVWGLLSGEPRGGASTITMQLARLRFGINTRTVAGKAEQMFRAVQLERHYSKDQILEAYLNLSPYGGNVEGIGAASLRWMGKKAQDLSFRECVAFSLVPQRPARRSPARAEPDASFAVLQGKICEVLRGEHSSGDEDFRLHAARRTLPRIAPHFTRRVLTENAGDTLTTTLDSTQQELLERSLADFMKDWHDRGLYNGCAMLVHAPTREVRAYAGSADFFNSAIHGQVDGIKARRSPGSLLKPFIYGLAMDQGLIHPRSLLTDAPATFGEYKPENFDREFAGPITAADALYRSRNLPAVALMPQLKAPGFYGFLKSGSVKLQHPASHYGLTLTLGGAEVRMDEAAALYALLAGDGTARPLRFLKEGGDQTKAPALLSPVACFLVRDMLHPRDPAPPDEGYTSGFSYVSWKTGTSHGYCDAWAAAICGDYVLVVWTGDFKGRSSAVLTGRTSAGPLLFQTLARLALPHAPEKIPNGVVKVDLCSVSGQLPGPHCPHQIQGWYLPGISPVASCALHQEIYIDNLTGLRVASNDGRPGLRREVCECWPPAMLDLFRRAGMPRREPPPMESTAGPAGQPPKIASPRAALTYSFRASDPSRRTVPLKADAAPGVRTVFWFAGSQFIGSSDPALPLLWTAVPGSSKLRVLDDRGRSAVCEVNVEVLP
jgi:penicillin-binding protein 1C